MESFQSGHGFLKGYNRGGKNAKMRRFTAEDGEPLRFAEVF